MTQAHAPMIIRALIFIGACVALAGHTASAQEKVRLFGSNDLIRVLEKFDETERANVTFGPHGAVGGLKMFCDAGRAGLVVANRQLTKAEIARCAGGNIIETAVTDPNLGLFYVYHDADKLATSPAIARAMQTIVAAPKPLVKAEVRHQCDVPQVNRTAERVRPPVPVFAWANPERVEEAKMTVEPVVFTVGFNYSDCFLRVVAIDRDSIFAKHLRVGQIFYGTHGFPHTVGQVELPYHPAVETPQTLRDKFVFAEKYGLNTIVTLVIYESKAANSDDPRNYIRVSSYKSPYGGVSDEEPVEYHPGCRFAFKKDCR